VNKRFWNNKSVLITGFEGFLGSNLTKTLFSSGSKIYGLDIKVGRKETILTAEDYKRLKVIKGDVADYPLLRDTILKNKINVVFHLAAEALVEKCQTGPLSAFSTNIEGAWKLLEACRNSKDVQSIVIASSDKAYGSHKKLPYKEEAPLMGRHPYDVSKSCADLISLAYFHSYGLPVAVTRCGNIYGPGDFNFSRLVPDATRCALSGQTFLIRSDGKFTRDFVYVDDIINGYILLAEKLRKLNLGGEAFNFSAESPIAVTDLVKKIFQVSGKKPNFKILNKVRHEIRHQYLASAKARKILGWRTSLSLEKGLQKTFEWLSDGGGRLR